MKATFACHLIAILIVVAFGVAYAFRSEFMAYHAVVIGMAWQEVSGPFQLLILGLMRAIGSSALAMAVLALFILLVPFRRGELWARWAIPIGGWLIAGGALYVMWSYAANTPARPPWIGPAVGAALLLIGLALSLGQRRRDSAI